MKKSLVFIITSVLVGGFMLSCSTNRGLVSSLTSADIQRVIQFDPLTFIRSSKGDTLKYNDSLSVIAKSLFETELSRSKTLPIKGNLVIEDSDVNSRIQDETYALMNLVNNVNVKSIPIPPTIDSILEARNERFGLLVYNYGFIRSLGTVYTLPYKDTNSEIIIVDSQNNNLVYVATAKSESSPLKAETYKKQVEDLLKKYKK